MDDDSGSIAKERDVEFDPFGTLVGSRPKSGDRVFGRDSGCASMCLNLTAAGAGSRF